MALFRGICSRDVAHAHEADLRARDRVPIRAVRREYLPGDHDRGIDRQHGEAFLTFTGSSEDHTRVGRERSTRLASTLVTAASLATSALTPPALAPATL